MRLEARYANFDILLMDAILPDVWYGTLIPRVKGT